MGSKRCVEVAQPPASDNKARSRHGSAAPRRCVLSRDTGNALLCELLLEQADLLLGFQEHLLGLVGALNLLAVEHQVLFGGIGTQLLVLRAQVSQGLVALGSGGAVAQVVLASAMQPQHNQEHADHCQLPVLQ